MSQQQTAPSADAIKQVQQKTAEIGERLKSDESFRQQYKRDPEAVLKAAGLPDAAVRELLSKAAKAAGADEVRGYNYHIDIYYPDGTVGGDYPNSPYLPICSGYEDFWW